MYSLIFMTILFIIFCKEFSHASSLAITLSIKVIVSLIRQPLVYILHGMLDLMNISSVFMAFYHLQNFLLFYLLAFLKTRLLIMLLHVYLLQKNHLYMCHPLLITNYATFVMIIMTLWYIMNFHMLTCNSHL